MGDAAFTALTTERLVLRRFRPEDLDTFRRLPVGPPATPGEWFQFADRNTGSAAVLERVGMRREGHLLESTWSKGEWTSDFLYAVLRQEWPVGY